MQTGSVLRHLKPCQNPAHLTTLLLIPYSSDTSWIYFSRKRQNKKNKSDIQGTSLLLNLQHRLLQVQHLPGTYSLSYPASGCLTDINPVSPLLP